MTFAQTRGHQRFCRKVGIKCASEKQVRKERDAILGKQDIVSTHIELWHKDDKAPDSINGMVCRPAPCVYITDLTTFVRERLDDYHRAGKLTWEDFPTEEIWIKLVVIMVEVLLKCVYK